MEAGRFNWWWKTNNFIKDTLDIYALDLSQGLDTSCPSWSTPSNVQNNGQYAPFMYGVGFAGPSNNTIYVQSGVGGTDQMARVVQYNTAGSWGGGELETSMSYIFVDLGVPNSQLESIQYLNSETRLLRELVCLPRWTAQEQYSITEAGGNPTVRRLMQVFLPSINSYPETNARNIFPV